MNRMRNQLYWLWFLMAVLLTPATTQAAQQSFSITVATPKNAFKMGDEVRIQVLVKNTSDHVLALFKPVDAGFLEVEIFDSKGNVVPLKESVAKMEQENASNAIYLPTQSLVACPLYPGQVLRDTLVANARYDLKQPGTYTLQLKGRAAEHNTIVKSNKASILVN